MTAMTIMILQQAVEEPEPQAGASGSLIPSTPGSTVTSEEQSGKRDVLPQATDTVLADHCRRALEPASDADN
jgi:hypothetical protein